VKAAIHTSETLDWVLNKIISPMTTDVFLVSFWEKQICHITRDNSVFFSPYFSFDALDRTIGFAWNNECMHFIKKGKTRTAFEMLGEKSRTLPAFYTKFCKGNAIVIEKMENRHRPIAVLTNEMSRIFGFTVTMDLYATPPRVDLGDIGAQGACFILQIDGDSFWKGKQNYRLRAGETLYLPRNSVMKTCGGETSGLFLVAKIALKTLKALILKALEKVSEEALSLRHSLPLGGSLNLENHPHIIDQCRQIFPMVMQAMNMEESREALAFCQKAELAPIPDQHFIQMRLVDDIGPETEIERRPGAVGQMRMFDGQAHLLFSGGLQTGPEKLFLAMDYLAEMQKFRPQDIPGWYSEEEKVLLVKHLVRKGFLRIVID
jgi:hypothetical protein